MGVGVGVPDDLAMLFIPTGKLIWPVAQYAEVADAYTRKLWALPTVAKAPR